MKKFVFVGLLLLIFIGGMTGCKSKAETLEENLISHTWSTVFANGVVSDMVFYANHTATAGEGIFSTSYDWDVKDNNQVTLSYMDGNWLCTVLFNVADDGENGYIFTFVEITTEPEQETDINHDNIKSSAERRFNTVTFTPKD